MNPEEYRNIYLLGTGGIGMSALARYFLFFGKNVAGYDRTSTELTKSLEKAGAKIHYKEDLSLIPKEFLSKENTLIIYTPAIPNDHSEFRFFIEKGFVVKKRAEILGEIANRNNCLAISGTHGKTTVTTMTAFILSKSTIKCNAFLGGISKNLGTNLILDKKSNFSVVEADEFDRSFLRLYPQFAVITSMDEDHLDIYGNKENIYDSFNEFASQVKQKIFVNKKFSDLLRPPKTALIFTYSANLEADIYPSGIRIKDGLFAFDYNGIERQIKNISMGVPGRFNMENALAAVSLCIEAGATDDEIRNAMSEFSGIKRRFETIVHSEKTIYIDDYAHHPEELRACISAAREIFPDKKISGVFQPHLYSRTKDFSDGFAKSLDLLDEAILLDLYPAREKPIPGISSDTIFHKMTLKNKKRFNSKSFIENTDFSDFEVLLTMGAGDIDQLVEPIKQKLQKS